MIFFENGYFEFSEKVLNFANCKILNQMKKISKRHLLLLASLCGVLLGWSASAQTCIRYIKPEDIGTKTLYADSVLTSITLPRGVSRLNNYPKFNVAAMELYQAIQDPDKDILQVWVCGSASPDGLWADNVKLSQARTDAAVGYLKSIIDIPDWKIHKESLNEDWDRLAELVEASDIPYKWEVLYIIRTKEWGERKTALQKLDGGRVWKILENDFFPQLRCVRFAIYCRWDPTKPHLSKPVEEQVKVVEQPAKMDTIYVRDTVFMVRETVYMAQEAPVTKEDAYEEYREKSLRQKKVWDTPWMAGVKTDVATDILALPQAGIELQLSKKVSLEMTGWYSKYAYIHPCDDFKVYGFRPELRYWVKDVMTKGAFFGVHANVAWYALMANDVDFYQNASLCTVPNCTKRHFFDYEYTDADGKKVMNHYHDTPAWSVGLTLGYALALDRKQHWAFEFVAGLGYAHYEQNHYQKSQPWNLLTKEMPQVNDYFGITRLSINIAYRFSLRRYNSTQY